MVLLQAGMTFAFLLEQIGKALLFFGIPILTVILFLVSVTKNKTSQFSTNEILKIVWQSFLKSVLTFFIIALIIFVILLFGADFSDT